MESLTEYLRAHLLQIDRLLRGDATRPDALEGRSLSVSVRGLMAVALLLAMFYGACMGSYSLLKQVPPEIDDPYGPALQIVATTIKVPALFLLTLVVTLPSLYVSNALIGSRLTLLGMLRLLVSVIAVNIAVLASLGTIVLFFSLTTNSYPFIVLLNVAAFSVAGVLGMMFLLQTLHRVTADGSEDQHPITADPVASHQDDPQPQAPPPEQSDEQADGQSDDDLTALDMPKGQILGLHTRLVFRCWMVLFSLVGAQMGWVLRPFIGQPDLPFTLFRARESNFFAAVLGAIGDLLFGG